jgi:hypothetical protein
MPLIWGTRLFGKVDQVGPKLHVATRFWHLYYLPLIPLESWVVTETIELSDEERVRTKQTWGTGDPWRGFPLKSLYWKSVLTAWFRAACIFVSLACSTEAFDTATRTADSVRWAVASTIGVACVVALLASYKLTRATEEQIVALGRLAGMSDDETLAHLGHTPVAIRGAGPTTPTGA